MNVINFLVSFVIVVIIYLFVCLYNFIEIKYIDDTIAETKNVMIRSIFQTFFIVVIIYSCAFLLILLHNSGIDSILTVMISSLIDKREMTITNEINEISSEPFEEEL